MTSHQLRIIAAITMAIDHIGLYLLDDYQPFRIIGRIAFPIFAFLIVVGYHHTRNKKAYMLRIALFGLISQIPYILLGNPWTHPNIMLTLLLGLLCLALYDRLANSSYQIVVPIGFCFISILLNAEYSILGILIIFCFHLGYPHNKKFTGLAAGLILLLSSSQYLSSENGASYLYFFHLLALPWIFAFTGKEGRKAGYFFYWFYPGHLLVIYLINLI